MIETVKNHEKRTAMPAVQGNLLYLRKEKAVKY